MSGVTEAEEQKHDDCSSMYEEEGRTIVERAKFSGARSVGSDLDVGSDGELESSLVKFGTYRRSPSMDSGDMAQLQIAALVLSQKLKF